MNIHPDVVKAYKKTQDAEHKHVEHGTVATKRAVTRTANTLSKKIKQHHPDLDMKGKIKLRTDLQNMSEGKTIDEYGGPKISRDAYLKAKPKPVQMEKGETAALIKKSHSKRGAPGTLKRKVKGKMTLAKARALKNRPGATTMDKKQANFFINMHSEQVQEDAAAMNTGAIPNPAQTAMGPSRLPTNIFRRKMGLPINVTDRRRKKDKPPKMRKKFRDFRNG